jgi:hypothetical protein
MWFIRSVVVMQGKSFPGVSFTCVEQSDGVALAPVVPKTNAAAMLIAATHTRVYVRIALPPSVVLSPASSPFSG